MVALLCSSAWCLVVVIVLWLLLAVPWIGLQCVIVVLSDHTHLFLWVFLFFHHKRFDSIVLCDDTLNKFGIKRDAVAQW